MKTWYYSPYPIAEDGEAVPLSASSQPPASGKRSKEKERGGSTEGGLDSPAPVGPTPVMRTHGRTADLLASSSLGRTAGFGDQAKLWVCDRCFKYMREGISWELHMVGSSGLVVRGWDLAFFRPVLGLTPPVLLSLAGGVEEVRR